MITQKQIDARDAYIAEFEECIGRILSEEDEDALTEKRQLVYDADKEAAGMKDEMLDALITLIRFMCMDCCDCHTFDFVNCDFNCGQIMDAKNIIERATGLTIDEAIKVWEAGRK